MVNERTLHRDSPSATAVELHYVEDEWCQYSAVEDMPNLQQVYSFRDREGMSEISVRDRAWFMTMDDNMRNKARAEIRRVYNVTMECKPQLIPPSSAWAQVGFVIERSVPTCFRHLDT